jgi:hypothetical protein
MPLSLIPTLGRTGYSTSHRLGKLRKIASIFLLSNRLHPPASFILPELLLFETVHAAAAANRHVKE